MQGPRSHDPSGVFRKARKLLVFNRDMPLQHRGALRRFFSGCSLDRTRSSNMCSPSAFCRRGWKLASAGDPTPGLTGRLRDANPAPFFVRAPSMGVFRSSSAAARLPLSRHPCLPSWDHPRCQGSRGPLVAEGLLPVRPGLCRGSQVGRPFWSHDAYADNMLCGINEHVTHVQGSALVRALIARALVGHFGDQ